MRAAAAVLLSSAALAWTAPVSTPPPPDPLPHIRVDPARGRVEFDARVALTLGDPPRARVFLEQFVCTPDTKEHESLLVTDARPSHVHAALLAVGLTPGKPVTWTSEPGRVVPHPPEGDRVRVEFIHRDDQGKEVVRTPSDWAVSARDGVPWPAGEFVFAGSILRDGPGGAAYLADREGTLVGLASFGTEVIAWPVVISHEAEVQAPEWIASAESLPPLGTPVVVRLTAVPPPE